MPVRRGTDSQGNYYQWGSNGKKYYYKTKEGEAMARAAAERQGVAAHASGYKSKGKP